ncbi:helix-turn-helix domain-containing protein [Streptomyces pseudoechinosporeus]
MTPDALIHDGGTMPGSFYTTDPLPAHRRRAYWRAALSQTFGGVNMAVPDEVRSAMIRTTPLGRLRAVTVHGESLSALRTRRLVAQGAEDAYVVLKLVDRGTGRVAQDGRTARLGPGDIFVYDTTRPVRLDLPLPFRTKSLYLPRDMLGLSESDLTRITASPLGSDTPLGALLSPFLGRLVDSAGTHPPRTGELLARNVVDLLGGLADERLGRAATGTDTPEGNRALLLRIRAFIDQHLSDPGLTPQVIARAHHISPRYLHKLFESEGVTVSRWIQRRRLEACRQDLGRRDMAGTAIAAVAHNRGFTSAAHFSRAFRAAYGMSPREWRETRPEK